MNSAVPDSLVTGHEDFVVSLSLRDPDDRHVLAVGIRTNADANEFRGQTLFSVFKNLARSSFGLRYRHSVSNLIRRAEAAIDQSAHVANLIQSNIFTNFYRKPKTGSDPNGAPHRMM